MLSSKQLAQCLAVEEKLFSGDEKILELSRAKNNLEALAYELRDGLNSNGQYNAYVDPKTRESSL